ncbi:uncharacterized protein PFL1_03107 [Pseudozyma flocculosa PF-1]|uniref:DUF803-domain-containing protein n=2 Tax=Pseudozyma flocculosa TaxID=84751 RepID=A0A5C3F1E1_9BASI|nr:uncharacterized protein PFL1_03107 [Pseudozyma flocculosa PF-1]EPQ29352.1 hypothetical protein PFL1_03107 [Pseudozyma flocculosa PF-1]SPO37870.1 uncharacterized protein PSFLO_03347 [Pseudozyma flocculosa]
MSATPTPTPTTAMSVAATAASATATSLNSSASASSASAAMSSLSAVLSSASAALASESSVASGAASNPPVFKFVGLALAVLSGIFIGTSFVFKKKGLLNAQKKYETQAGEGHAYLKSPMWWTGMIIMVLGEVFNFVAYAFADAVLVTPLGALSVVICAILSSIFLKEKLTLFGKVGCFLCIVGSVIIALNAPSHAVSGNIVEYQKLFLAPGFLVWASLCAATALVLVFVVAPRYGKKNMMVYITVCSLIGGLSVSVTSGLGAAILLSIRGQNQFKHWFMYFLLAFVVVTLLVEINYLNKALELFNTATVTPTYYVIFTAATLVTSIILQQGLQASAVDIVTLVMGFLVICAGIVLLQLSKIDPQELQDKPGLDRGTTLLLRASRSVISHSDEKGETTALEDPGVDTIRGGLGVVGSMMRARSSRRLSGASSFRHHSAADEYTLRSRNGVPLTTHGSANIERYQLHDNPMMSPGGLSRDESLRSVPPFGLPSQHRETTISFASGSEEPHGHHAVAAASSSPLATPRAKDFAALPGGPLPSSSSRPQSMLRDNSVQGLSSIREASGGSGLEESTAAAPMQTTYYIDPYAPAPAQGQGLPRSTERTNIKTMWEPSNLSHSSSMSSPSASPQSEDYSYDFKERNDGDDDETDDDEKRRVGSSATSSTAATATRERNQRSYPKRGGRKGDVGSDTGEEEEELLSPRIAYR